MTVPFLTRSVCGLKHGILFNARAVGGVEAEREERQRQRDEEQRIQNENFEAMKRIQEKARAKRLATYGPDEEVSFPPRLQEFRDSQLDKIKSDTTLINDDANDIVALDSNDLLEQVAQDQGLVPSGITELEDVPPLEPMSDLLQELANETPVLMEENEKLSVLEQLAQPLSNSLIEELDNGSKPLIEELSNRSKPLIEELDNDSKSVSKPLIEELDNVSKPVSKPLIEELDNVSKPLIEELTRPLAEQISNSLIQEATIEEEQVNYAYEPLPQTSVESYEPAVVDQSPLLDVNEKWMDVTEPPAEWKAGAPFDAPFVKKQAWEAQTESIEEKVEAPSTWAAPRE